MRKIYLLLSLTFLFLLSCENNLEMSFPKGPQGEQGPQGEKGDKGDDGLSAFDLWKMLYEKDNDTPMSDFFDFLKGEDGRDGTNGVDGHTPQIGSNGNWWINGEDTGVRVAGIDGFTPNIGDNGNWYINGEDTGVPAAGRDGANGISPTIGSNGNWYIGDQDTGVPAAGKDGVDGSDGVSPTIGANGNWYINGTDTGVKAEGVDGADGVSPTIGANGNWYLDGEDTGIPATGANGIDGVTPTIGANGNWFIGSDDTGVPARGADGNDGQSAYELWRDAVEAGEMTNKDGSDYTDGSSWEDFVVWLQGGSVSVLHQYWLSQGNDGDLEAFFEALFSCKCKGIAVSVYAPNECINLLANGTVVGEYSANVIVVAEEGTSVQISINGATETKTVATGENKVEFDVTRGESDVTVTIVATLPSTNEQITKTVIVPALQYMLLESVNVVQVGSEQQDEVSITFEEAPAQVRINNQIIYESDSGIVSGSSWAVSNSGRTFTRTYNRQPNSQTITVRATGEDGECSIFTNLFTIPSLDPLEFTGEGEPIIGECDVTITLEGTPGMTMVALFDDPSNNNEPTTVSFTESPAGVYQANLPRTYQHYDIVVEASKEGQATITRNGSMTGPGMLPYPFEYEPLSYDTSLPTLPVEIRNLLNREIEVVISRTANTNSDSEVQNPWLEDVSGINETFTVTIAANGSQTVVLARDVAPGFADGEYGVIISSTSQCGKMFSLEDVVVNKVEL